MGWWWGSSNVFSYILQPGKCRFSGVSFRVADLARSVIYIFLTLKDITKHFWRVNSGHNLMTYFDPLPVSNGAPHASIIIVSPLSVVELHT